MIRRWPVRAAASAALVLAFGWLMLTHPLGGYPSVVVDDLGELGAATLAALGAFRAARRGGPMASSWRLVGAGCAVWATGQLLWSGQELVGDPTVPFPGPADVGFLAFPVLAGAGLLRWPADRTQRAPRLASLLDGGVVAGALLMLSWATSLGAAWDSAPQSLWALLTASAYPVGDVLLCCLSLLLLARAPRAARLPLALLGSGMCALALADSAFVFASANQGYQPAQVINTGWVAGFLMIALAGDRWAPLTGQARQDAGSSLARTCLPYLPLLPAEGLVVVPLLTEQKVPAVQAACGVVLFLLVLARQFLMLVENRALTARLREGSAELVRRAHHDPLTGLPNRLHFAQQVAAAVTQRDGGVLAVLYCDLDGFKTVNDTQGHSAGDELLVGVAQRLLQCRRGPQDEVARLGGDEFAVLLPGADADQALALAERLIARVAEPVTVRGHRVHVGVTVGVALTAVAGQPGELERGPCAVAEELLLHADVAMYAAKAAGRGRCLLFDRQMLADSQQRALLIQDLHGAVARGEITVVYQPVASLETGQVDGVEGLARWTHPVRGPVPPDVFIPLAEDAGLIHEIGAFVLAQTLAAGEAFARASGRRLNVGVNVSALQLSPDGILALVATGVLEHLQLVLEVTETVLLRREVVPVLAELRRRGVLVAMDDFGVGQSSIGSLRLMPIDIIKLDRSFTADITADHRAAGIVRAVIAMARELGLALVAEGVETTEQAQLLHDLGCRIGQGYLISRPVPLLELCAQLRRGQSAPTASCLPSISFCDKG